MKPEVIFQRIPTYDQQKGTDVFLESKITTDQRKRTWLKRLHLVGNVRYNIDPDWVSEVLRKFKTGENRKIPRDSEIDELKNT